MGTVGCLKFDLHTGLTAVANSTMVLPLGVREPGADFRALKTVEARDKDH